MKRRMALILIFFLAMAANAPTRAGDGDEARAILDKAIKAHGGEEKLRRFQTWSVKFKGKNYVDGQVLPFTGQRFVRLPNQSRVVVDCGEGDGKYRQIRVLNGDRGWTMEKGRTAEMNNLLLAAEKDDLYADRLEKLVTIKEGSFKLSPLHERKIDGRRVMGIRVTHEGYRDFTLLFDSSTGLLVKTEHRYKSEESKESISEVFFEGYKEFEGIQCPTKVALKVDNKKALDEELSDYRRHDKFEDELFSKP